jgi:hypothetical protein
MLRFARKHEFFPVALFIVFKTVSGKNATYSPIELQRLLIDSLRHYGVMTFVLNVTE